MACTKRTARTLLRRAWILLELLVHEAALVLQAKLDIDDEQKGALRQAMQKYRGELHALAIERKSLNAVLAQAAAPGKPDSIKKVPCPSYVSQTTFANANSLT